MALKREEEEIRINSSLADKHFIDFQIYQVFELDRHLHEIFAAMQRIYVPNPNDYISIDKLTQAIKELWQIISNWTF